MKIVNPFKILTRYLTWLAALWLVVAPALAAEAPVPVDGGARNSIESLEHTKLENGKIIFKIGLHQPLQNPPIGFAINNPPRIVLDFPDTANTLGKNTYDVGDTELRNLNIVQSGTRTRLVVNVARMSEYETKVDGNKVLLIISHPEAVKVSPGAPQRFAEPKLGEPKKQSLRNVDFRRGSNGEGRVVVDLSDPNTGIDIRNLGNNLVVDFSNATLVRDQERRLDVVDFGTPVQTVETFTQGNNVRMSIESKGLWEYSAYQADRQFIVDIKKVQADPNKLVPSAKAGYSGEKLSLAFQNQDVRAILQVF
ncbi:MAG: AMIN domain-containing protein, partial [Sulfuricella sp.]|nr:AMIN domain-containing protein [Sulfuricella sp.]